MYRFSPSPTGKLHLGSLRTAVVSYILSKQNNSSFILRIEDTDKARSEKRWADEIMETLQSLKLAYEPNVVYQSDRSARYKEVVERLIEYGYAYYCSCSMEDLKAMKRRQIMTKSRIGYEGTCRHKENTEGIVRLNVPALFGSKISFTDSIFGSKTVDYRELSDAVLMRANGDATYLLANTVDDYDARVSHVVRGADLLPQTFLQICLVKALNKCYQTHHQMNYTHLPLMLDENKEKISKRKEDTKSILSYLHDGAFPDALIQFVLSIGNSSISTSKALTLDEMIQCYDVSKTSIKNTQYLEHKLWFINKLHLKHSSPKALRTLLKKQYNTDLPEGLITLLKVRYRDLQEISVQGKKIIELYLEFAEDKKYLPETLEEIKQYRKTVFKGEPTPPINELLPVLQQELMTTARV